MPALSNGSGCSPAALGTRRTMTPMQACTTVIGRESELERVRDFVDRAPEGSGALLIEGEPGIGKTTLWQAGLDRALVDCTVLSCRPVQAEATLSFSGLGDLLGDVLDGVLEDL